MMVGKVVKYKLKGAVAQAPTKRPELFSRKALQLWSFALTLCFQYFDRLTLVFHIFVPREQEKGLLHGLLSLCNSLVFCCGIVEFYLI